MTLVSFINVAKAIFEILISIIFNISLGQLQENWYGFKEKLWTIHKFPLHSIKVCPLYYN
ncbi:MAG: hypothetical protein N2053_04545 [Chitinispirillaceae bacterium]|nr:hypothetical protein [Chitinispirillaceae bacterium]